MSPVITRRDFLKCTAAALATPGAAAADGAGVTAAGAVFAYVGSYTPNGGGIYLFRMDLAAGAFTQLQVVDGIRNPTWLAINPARSRLYAVSEIDNHESARGGAVVTYAIDPQTALLTRLGTVSSYGALPTHVSVHPAGKHVFVANYGGGNVAVLPVNTDGTLGEASDVRPSVGPRHRAHALDDPPGQFAVSDHDSPHMHMVLPDPSGQYVIANDSGLDLTLIWRFDDRSGRLLPADVPVVMAPSGASPRHFAFHPNGRVFYNLYEHDAKVAVYDYDPERGALILKQMVSALPPKFAGSNLSSEILASADGKFVYVANRLHNAVSIFAVAGDGQLRMIGETWVHADYPRGLTLDPRGDLLFSCNQKGDSITAFRVNASNGLLQFTGRFEPLGSPAMMIFLTPPRA